MPTGLIASAVTAALVICGEQTSPFMRRRSAGSSGGAPNGGCTTSPARALTSTRKPPRRLWRRSPPANPSAAPAYSAPPGNWTGCCASTWSRRWRPPTAAPAASPVASARRWRTSMSATAPERATPPSKAPGRRPSATRCWTHPPGCAPGSWRTCGPGPTTPVTSGRSSASIMCWTTSPCTAAAVTSPRGNSPRCSSAKPAPSHEAAAVSRTPKARYRLAPRCRWRTDRLRAHVGIGSWSCSVRFAALGVLAALMHRLSALDARGARVRHGTPSTG